MQLLQSFQRKIVVNIDAGNYLIKTAVSKEEVIASLQLRHLVFINEFLGESFPSGLDIDRYDTHFDHLVVIQKKSAEVIATYRMLASENFEDFYSNSEFDLLALSGMQGPFLEVGRACVHPNHRRSIVLNLLWRGISEYLNQTNCKFLMGCGSIKTQSTAEVGLLLRYFQSLSCVAEQNFEPRASYRMDFNASEAGPLSEHELVRAQKLVPPLFNSYLRAGAKVGSEPAWDRDFKCIDYLILLKKSDIDSVYGKRFGISAKET